MTRLFSNLFLLAALPFSCFPLFVGAQSLYPHGALHSDNIRETYTKEHPLVYEDAWNLWPYAFLNETGEPAGYNIDLVDMILKELGIAYKVKLKPMEEAMADVKCGRADLMCGMDAKGYNDYAHYGKSVIQIFTQSTAYHKDARVFVKTVDDLATQRVLVHESSLTLRLMIERGWKKNAIPYNDMQEAVQKAHNEKKGQIIGNTMSLKWLIHKFGYDDMELADVNIPHGEYKFMSNDVYLLELMDSVFSELNSSGRLQPIQNKWFYSEHKDTGIPSWVWYMVGGLLVVTLTGLVFYVCYRLYERQMRRGLRRSNARLALILTTSKVHVWLYDIATLMVTSVDEGGRKLSRPLSPYFGQYYMLPDDFDRLNNLLGELSSQKREQATVEIEAMGRENREKHIFSVDLSVMNRDRRKRPTVIVGAATDITAARERQQQQKDAMLRYQYIFNSTLVDNVSYDEHGFIDDMNEKATKGVGGNIQRIIDAHISIQSVLGDPGLSLDDLDYTYLTQLYKGQGDNRPLARILGRNELYYEIQVLPIRDDLGRLLCIYATGRDVTEIAKSYSRLQKNIVKLQEANDELQDYVRNIDYVMKNGGLRIVNYSPATHTLTIYSEIERIQLHLTQTRLLSLAAEESKNTALRIMNNMDNLTRQPVKAIIKSTLNVKGKVGVNAGNMKTLCLLFSFVPVTDDKGRVTDYFGMCRDISDIKATEELLALETKKAQEVETVKDAFLRNMCYEIRTPLNSVVGFAELIEQDHHSDEEQFFIEEIKKNSRSLLNLVNNILLLSRLDAGMIELKPTPVDFAVVFKERCKSVWMNCQQPGVAYFAESFYDHLVLDIDMNNLGIVIDQIVTNAVQRTTSGYVRARFDYNGEDLTVTVQDTGCGIPADKLRKIFERFVTTDNGSSGLGLSICQEIVKLMGGKIRLKSEVGKGTTFWIIIPCTSQASREKGEERSEQ